MYLNLTQTPFSMNGSYFAISYYPENREQFSKGIYLRTVHYSSDFPYVCRLIPMSGGRELAFSYIAEPAELQLVTEKGTIYVCFGDERTILFFTASNELSMRFDFMSEHSSFDFAYELPAEGKSVYMLNCLKNNGKYLADPLKGELIVDQNWAVRRSEHLYLDIRPENDQFLFSLTEIDGEWDGKNVEWEYDKAKEKIEKDFYAFYNSMPEVPKEYEEGRKIAAYVNWSGFVNVSGNLTRKAMLMSKNWMTKIWSWDHCFNAICLSYSDPKAAWDQFMLLFDYQHATGQLPDCVMDSYITWNFCKPPIHGWALAKMMKHMTLTNEQVCEAYEKLSRWTKWWFQYRDWNHNGICEYAHGNDSGWDNSTAFAELPLIETPDLSAFLVLQAEVLEELAERLGRCEEAESWHSVSENTLEKMLEYCFDKDGFPLSRRALTGEIVENKSLIVYMPIILGKRLPEKIRSNMINKLKSEGFLTEWGLATESVNSMQYKADGYWRGPIWAPSTMLLLDGLCDCGETELVKNVAQSFAMMVLKSGCAENFDALTGEGLRDRAYTWTSSAFLVMSHEYLLV